jgi:hypothetical protein
MKVGSLVIGAAMIVAIPALAAAAPLHAHFSGYADHNGPAPGSYVAGNDYTAYATLDAVQPDPWYAFLAGQEYTVVITTTVTAAYENPAMILNVEFADAVVEIYEDNTTPADYANPGTFTDGVLVLSGIASNMAGQRPNFSGFNWDVTGSVSFDGGAGLGGLLCEGPIGMNDFIAFQQPPINPPNGYREAYNVDWFCEGTTSVEQSTWGRMKGLYR